MLSVEMVQAIVIDANLPGDPENLMYGTDAVPTANDPIDAIDFLRSFVTFRTDTLKKPSRTASHKPPFTLNNARAQLECRCRMTDKASGHSEEFVLGHHGKTERVGVERDIWMQPNAEYSHIFSDRHFVVLKTYEHIGVTVQSYPPGKGIQGDRYGGDPSEAYDSVRIDLGHCQGWPLTTAEQIVAAVLKNLPMAARTEIEDDRCLAVIDYPVKTINANERDNIYQTDTGPVLLPDFAREPAQWIGGLELAFSSFNSPDWIEFIVRCPVPVGQGVSVYHYGRTSRFDARNQIICLQHFGISKSV